jgi:hypothetical protein
MNVRARIRALERKQAIHPGPVGPPIEFFDAIIAGTATKQGWNRWGLWLRKNILDPPNIKCPLPEAEGRMDSEQ